jgi:hypothetical protein
MICVDGGRRNLNRPSRVIFTGKLVRKSPPQHQIEKIYQ